MLTRLAGFAVLPLLALVMPFLLMPIIGVLVGPEGWSSAIAGQSIGAIASVLVLWGWNVDGTVQVARAVTEDARAEVYARSVRTRLLLSVAIFPLAVVAAVLVARPGFADEASAMALGYTLLGFSPAWYGIGVGKPSLLGLYDTLPRFAATVTAAPLLLLTRTLWPFPVLMAVATAVSLWFFHRRFAPGRPWLPRDFRGALADLNAQRHTAGINMAGQVYAQTPTPIATATTPALTRRHWDLLGGFGEDYFAYLEDMDLCWRTHQLGLPVAVLGDAVAWHHYEYGRTGHKRYLLERNRLLFLLTNHEAGTLAALALPLVALEGAMLVLAVAQGWAGQKVRGWGWLLRHPGRIARRRRLVQAARRVPDADLFDLMTTRFSAEQEEMPAAGRLLEAVLQGYWAIARRTLRGSAQR